MSKTEKLKEIKNEIVNLKKSPLYKERVKNSFFPVIGEGNHNAKVMFIGEAPGKNEAQKGRPFCGNAGKKLDELLASINIKRDSVYITNIVKDRPPSNRDPLPDEIKIYSPFLDRQINIIQPSVIACLGRFSSHYILQKFNLEEEIRPIGLIRGNIYSAKSNYGKIKIICLFHPASIIYDFKKKDILISDFKKIKKLITN